MCTLKYRKFSSPRKFACRLPKQLQTQNGLNAILRHTHIPYPPNSMGARQRFSVHRARIGCGIGAVFLIVHSAPLTPYVMQYAVGYECTGVSAKLAPRKNIYSFVYIRGYRYCASNVCFIIFHCASIPQARIIFNKN